jgi:phage FluMu protein Com
MTVKVISPGKIQWQAIYEAQCYRCKCIFTCNESDGEYVPLMGTRPDDGDFVRIKCPNCKNECVAYNTHP